jgi:hypothetical protein
VFKSHLEKRNANFDRDCRRAIYNLLCTETDVQRLKEIYSILENHRFLGGGPEIGENIWDSVIKHLK